MKVSTWMPKHSPLPRTLADHCVELVETEIGVVE
jgi:hypothetical protein